MSTERLSADLSELLGREDGAGISMDEVVAMVGRRGYGLLLVVLSLPSAMPVPAPGYSTPFGIALFLVGLQILVGRRTPWLPGWVRSRRLSSDAGKRMLTFLAGALRRTERWVRPRHEWVFGRGGNGAVAALTLFMAGLMIFPIPLTNTAPALVIFLLGIGMIEKDGALLGVAALLGCAAALLYLAAFAAIFYYGLHGMEEVKEVVKGWLGR